MSVEKVLIRFFEPLYLVTVDRSFAIDLLKSMGWEIHLNDVQYETFSEILNISQSLSAFISALKDLTNQEVTGQDVQFLLRSAAEIFSDVQSLKNINLPALAQLPSPLDETDFWMSFVQELPHYLVLRYLRVFYPPVYEILHFGGAIEEIPIEGTDKIKRYIEWDKLSDLISSPLARLASQYQWGVEFEHEELLGNIHRVCRSMGVFPEKAALRQEFVDLYYGSTPAEGASELYATIYNGWVGDGAAYVESSVSLIPVPVAPNGDISGLGFVGAVSGNVSAEISVSDQSSLIITAGADMNGVLALMLQPDGVRLSTEIPDLDFKIEWNTVPEAPWIIIGDAQKTRLEISGFNAGLSVHPDDEDYEFLVFGKIADQNNTGLKLVIAPAEGDNFISKILGSDELVIGTDLEALWSSKTGFAFKAGNTPALNLDTDIPVNFDLGVIYVDTLHIKAAVTPESASLKTTVTGGIDIKILKAVAEDIGIEAKLIPVENNQGALGPFDLKLGFKPPSGLGISIDAKDVVKGGGYLEFDHEEGRYAGAAEFKFAKLTLSAIGILSTRMPDGSKNWSLFLSIFGEFPAIQLGFGFTLNGVGGLIGINRALDDEALRQRMLAGAMDSIMFPEDPVEHAPQIIRDIEAIFPAVEGQFILGLMMKFGWGTPTILSVELGVMVELPDPLRIALLGQVSALLPLPDAVIVELHMDVFGLADLTARSLSIDAVLRDSHIMELITLSGDMALRASFAGRPNMLMAVGGFHPDFNPPASFPELRLIKASLPLGDNASVDLSSYVAFTSNTFQIGGRLDVWASFSGFTAEGYIEMDALIQFVPFGFDVHVEFGVSVSAGSIRLMAVQVGADIRGPGRWEIIGYAQFEILKIKKKMNLEIAFGHDANNPAEVFNVGDLVYAALADRESWEIKDNPRGSFVRLRERSEAEGSAVHPDARIDVVQKIAPLGMEIETFGGGNIAGERIFEVENILVGDGEYAVEDGDYLRDWFAPANFFEMDDEQKITAPSFEEMNGGIALQNDEVHAGEAIDLEIKHEEICIDALLNQRRKHKKQRAALSGQHLSKFDKTGSPGKWAQANLAQSQKIEPQFVVR